LADGFLDDLDELDDSDEEVEDEEDDRVDPTASSSASASTAASADATIVAAPRRKRAGGLSVKESFVEHMRRVRALLSESPLPLEGVLETHPEYLLIVKSNTLLLEIVDEIGRVHRRLADVYAKRFPELETLVPNPLVYVRVAQRIGNELDMMTVDLDDLLPSAQVMVVTVTGSTSVGAALSAEAYGEVVEACAEVLELEAARNDIMSFVEGRMGVIAPNLSAIVGTMVSVLLCTVTFYANLAHSLTCSP
jgi:U4/U6 small nuclear ribonucleoprotein PRP31